MAGMEVDLEIHAPGLDLHHQRWNYHVLFMDEVHASFDRLARLSWQSFSNHGRGTLFVDRDDWMTVIRDRWDKDEVLFPCRYVAVEKESLDPIFLPLRAGFEEMVWGYEPANQFVLTVEHHSANLLSTYLMRSDPGPKNAYQNHHGE